MYYYYIEWGHSEDDSFCSGEFEQNAADDLLIMLKARGQDCRVYPLHRVQFGERIRGNMMIPTPDRLMEPVSTTKGKE